MQRKTIWAASAVLLLAFSCGKQETNNTKESELVSIEVSFNIGDVLQNGTRSSNALYPEVENWIYDYYYSQFDSRGLLVQFGHRRAAVMTGDLVVTDNVTLHAGSNCTVAFVANIVPSGSTYGDNPGWESGTYQQIADNIDSYKLATFDMSERIQQAQAGTLRHMPMCGYWEGDITGNTSMTATLGRMISRLNVTITNSGSAAVTQVTLNNASTRAYVYPQVQNLPLEVSDYTTLTDNVTIAAGQTETLYFYTAPNYCNGGGKRTSLTFTAGSKTGTIDLGDNIDQDDYNLYMNTAYNFNINVK